MPSIRDLFGSFRIRPALLALAAALAQVAAGPAQAFSPGLRPGFVGRAGASPVSLGEVASSVRPGTTRLGNVKELLRRDVEAELAAIDWSKHKVRRKLLVSASVVRLQTSLQRTGRTQSASASCTVTAALRDAERGTLLAVVHGKALAEDLAAARAERDALAGAVRGAVGALPEAIRRLP